MKLRVRSHFDAAHRLPRYAGDCARLHGHRWEVLVDLSAVVPASSGMAIDFKTAKSAIREALPDHQFLNDFYDGRQPEGEAEFNPTAENLAAIILHDIRQALPGYAEVIRFELFESPDCSVIIDGGEGHDTHHRQVEECINEIRAEVALLGKKVCGCETRSASNENVDGLRCRFEEFEKAIERRLSDIDERFEMRCREVERIASAS